MNLQIEFNTVTAIKVATFFETSGLTDEADRMWFAIKHMTAYDRDLRAHFGDIIFDSRKNDFELGTVARSRFILYLMAMSFPTPKLAGAYFQNLRHLLRSRAKLSRPGQIVLGMGSGRCGSTTLSAAFRDLPGVCATHENPPHVFWQPLEEQVRFHLDRLRLLADYFPLVFDAAHWWFNLSGRVVAEFPKAKFVGLVRETEPCVQSFLRFQAVASVNSWAPPNNGVWRTELWDPTYPKYALPEGIAPDTEAAYRSKVAMITRYVTDYNRALIELAAAQPQHVLLIRTEALNDPTSAARLSSFVGTDVAMPAKSYNVGTDSEGIQPDFWF